MQLDKEFQGKGYGKEILQHIEIETKKRGLPKIKLSVFNDNPAKKIYKKVGYELVDKNSESLSYEKKL